MKKHAPTLLAVLCTGAATLIAFFMTTVTMVQMPLFVGVHGLVYACPVYFCATAIGLIGIIVTARFVRGRFSLPHQIAVLFAVTAVLCVLLLLCVLLTCNLLRQTVGIYFFTAENFLGLPIGLLLATLFMVVYNIAVPAAKIQAEI